MNKPDETPPAGAGDRSLRFLFEQADIRGETVHLDDAYRDILAIHQYAPGVSHLLGEFLAHSLDTYFRHSELLEEEKSKTLN